MNLLLTLESLKFYKLRHERNIQIWFVLLLAIHVGVFYLPVGDKDFTAFFEAVNAMAAGEAVMPVLTSGNLIILGLQALLSLVDLLFVFFYAALYVGEATGLSLRRIYAGCLRAMPRLLVFIVLLLVPALFSFLLFMVPLFIFVTMVYLLPVLLMHDRQKLTLALGNSYQQTRGFRLMIFTQIFILSILISLPENLVLAIVPNDDLAVMLAQSFFAILHTFIQGRLMGILYLFLVKKAPVMIPSEKFTPPAEPPQSPPRDDRKDNQ